MQTSEYQRIEQLESTHFWYRAMEEWSLDVLEKHLGNRAKILDAGCGTGGMTKKLAALGNVVGVDINPVPLQYAKKKGINVLQASVNKLPFPKDSFDAVVSFDVLYHQGVSDDQKAIEEFFRVLKPGGVLFMRNPALEILRGSHDRMVSTRHRYTVHELKEKMQKTGFTIEKISYANMVLSIPLFFKRWLDRVNKKQEYHSDVVLLPAPVNELFYRILQWENRIIPYVSLPFGSSVVCLARKDGS